MKYYLLKYVGTEYVSVSVKSKLDLTEWLKGRPVVPEDNEYHQYATGQELVDEGIVEMFEITKTFYDLFDNMQLNELTTCTIFDEFENDDIVDDNYTDLYNYEDDEE